jgi:hypothetical protein
MYKRKYVFFIAPKSLKLYVSSKTMLQVIEKIKLDKEKEILKFVKQSKKQDKMLFVAFYILLNLAEDIVVERKMLRKNLIDSLISTLDHTFAGTYGYRNVGVCV